MAKATCDVLDCGEPAVQVFVLEADDLTISRCETHTVPAVDVPPSATPIK